MANIELLPSSSILRSYKREREEFVVKNPTTRQKRIQALADMIRSEDRSKCGWNSPGPKKRLAQATRFYDAVMKIR